MTDRLQYWQRGRLIFGAELGSRDKLVLLAISDHLGSNATAWPSHGRLAKRCGMAKRTVVRSLEWLETHEVITVHRLPGGNNRYQISIKWLKAHQCQSDTSDSVTLVSESHAPQCHKVTTPVSESHGGSVTESPEGDHEGDHEGDQSSRPAGLTGQRIDHLSRADKLWPELVRDLQAAGYRTLEQLAEDGRDSVAAALGSGASRGRLDRLQTVLQRNGHDWATQGRRGSHGARETAANTNRPDRPASRPDRAPAPEEVALRWAPGTAPFDQPDIYLIGS